MLTILSKNRIIIGIAIIAIAATINSCKSGQEKNLEKTEITDTISDEVVKDTSSVSVTKTIATEKPLTIIIQNLASATAPVYISIYGNRSKFPDPKGQLNEYKFRPNGKELTVQIPNLKFGTYSVASYQDVNSNGKIDKNFIGIPTECYAFSNNYKPTVKAPRFEDCSFAYNKKHNSITIKMIK